nr:hypothetical protein [uncultured Pseudomonas sp.]
MHKTLVFSAILLCACANQPFRQYSSGQATHVRLAMEQCAAIIAQHLFMLAPAEADWHYQRCLVQNKATI